MQAFFSPAVALMNRLGYTRKFGIMGLLVAVALAVLMYNLHLGLDRTIQASRMELLGIEALKPVERLIQTTQQHRGLSSGVLNGNEAMKEKRAAKEKEITDAINGVEAKLKPELASGDSWREIKSGWERMRAEGLSWTAADNFSAHTAIIDKMIFFSVTVADEYSMTLDPEDRKSTRLNSSHIQKSRMPSSA